MMNLNRKYSRVFTILMITGTPNGSIIDIRNVGRRRKPETDPDWEEREAERKATKARRLCGSD